MTPRQQPYAYVRSYYGVNPVPGERVRFTDGREGAIARRQSYDNYVYVKFDGCNHALPCHPTDLTYGIDAATTASAGGDEAKRSETQSGSSNEEVRG